MRLAEPDAQLDSDHITDLGLLVGIDQYFRLVQGQKRVDKIYFIETARVCVIARSLPDIYVPKNIHTNVTLVARVNAIEQSSISEANTELESITMELWELESINIKPVPDTPE